MSRPHCSMATGASWWAKHGGLSILLDQEVTSSTYIGQNTFGAKASVTKKKIQTYGVRIDEEAPDKRLKFTAMPELKVSRSEAPKVKNNLMGLAIGKLKEPAVLYEEYSHEPTGLEPTESSESKSVLDLPLEEVVIFRADTGEVLTRLMVQELPVTSIAKIKARRCSIAVRLSNGPFHDIMHNLYQCH